MEMLVCSDFGTQARVGSSEGGKAACLSVITVML